MQVMNASNSQNSLSSVLSEIFDADFFALIKCGVSCQPDYWDNIEPSRPTTDIPLYPWGNPKKATKRAYPSIIKKFRLPTFTRGRYLAEANYSVELVKIEQKSSVAMAMMAR